MEQCRVESDTNEYYNAINDSEIKYDEYAGQPQEFTGLNPADVIHQHLLLDFLANPTHDNEVVRLLSYMSVDKDELDYKFALGRIREGMKILPPSYLIDYLENEFDNLGIEDFYNKYGISDPQNIFE